MTSVTIPNSVTSIGDYAFYGCVSLTSIVVEDGNAVYDSRNNCNAIIETSTDKLIVGCRNTIIPNTVTSIGNDAFSCSVLTSVTIPNSVTSIGSFAFSGCSVLTSVTIPNSVTSIGDYAFEECIYLKEATVGCKWKENPVYTFDSNVTVNATLHSYTDGICTECGHAVIIDGAVTEYSVAVERACPITYTRTFNNTEWQALYVPFAMSYDDWKEDFDVAKINDIHQFDVNNDGDFDDAEDKTIMEMLKVNNGTLKANNPYMIRAKSTGEKSITIENATLMPTEVNSIDCSSVERKYVFTGTYNTIDGETMVNNKYYAMSGGGVKYTTSTSVSLKPFRWYMQIMDRDGQLLESAAEIKVVVSGEDDWDVTGIESVKDGDGTFKVYSIGGVLVRSVKAADIKQATEGLPKGLYIVNGKKCNVR